MQAMAKTQPTRPTPIGALPSSSPPLRGKPPEIPAEAHPFYKWLVRYLAGRGSTMPHLFRHLGLAESTFYRWRSGSAPSVEIIRDIAHALELEILPLLVIAGILLPHEVEFNRVVPDVELLTDEAMLLELLARRDGSRRDASPAPTHRSE